MIMRLASAYSAKAKLDRRRDNGQLHRGILSGNGSQINLHRTLLMTFSI